VRRLIGELHLCAQHELHEALAHGLDELPRQNREHIARRELHQAQQRDDATLRIVITGKKCARPVQLRHVVR
jgi:hypothetical protein